MAGVPPGEVSMAGLKDRQGVTRQYMSVRRGKAVRLEDPELTIEPVGFADHELTSADSEGNGFEIIVRDLSDREERRLRAALSSVREFGLPNYFDEQRFGNLRHAQGWIALELVQTMVFGGVHYTAVMAAREARAAEAAGVGNDPSGGRLD